jgi:hypothetical protein
MCGDTGFFFHLEVLAAPGTGSQKEYRLEAACAHRMQLGILIETDNFNCECYFLTG